MTLINNQLPRSTPEAQGISSAAILSFVEAVESQIHELHSFMLLRHGSVVAEGWWSPYGPDRLHMLFSLSKSFTSSAIGLAVEEKRLSVDEKVLSFFPEDAPEVVSENLAAMRVRDLLSMTTGHDFDTTGALRSAEDGNWTKAFLAQPVAHKPGTFFLYNTGATYMLSAIIQKVTGMMLLDYLQPRLLEPLGIKDTWWEVSPQGVNMGGFGYNARTEDIARFCQMYLQKGVWNGKQILSEAWVEEATSKKISNGTNPERDWEQGYAYQFWRCRHNAYRGDGAFGQFGIVMPEQDAVLAITSGVGDMQQVLDLIWDHLLPAMQNAPLPEDPAAHARLTEKLASLALLPVQGQATSPIAEQIAGKTYELEGGPIGFESFRIEFADDQAVILVQLLMGELTIMAGNGTWIEGDVPTPYLVARCCVSGAWTADDTYMLVLRAVETPFYFTITARFSGAEQVAIDANLNTYFYPVNYSLVGKLTEN